MEQSSGDDQKEQIGRDWKKTIETEARNEKVAYKSVVRKYLAGRMSGLNPEFQNEETKTVIGLELILHTTTLLEMLRNEGGQVDVERLEEMVSKLKPNDTLGQVFIAAARYDNKVNAITSLPPYVRKAQLIIALQEVMTHPSFPGAPRK